MEHALTNSQTPKLNSGHYTLASGVPQRLGRALERVSEILGQAEMLRKWEEWLDERFPAELHELQRERISKIIAASKPKPHDSAAKLVYIWEVEASEAKFDIPRECILRDSDEGFCCDFAVDPRSAKRFQYVFQDAIWGSQSLRGWARFLPCSLEPDAFMRSHHNGVFRNRPVQEANSYAEAYNAIGSQQRKRFEASIGKRLWNFTHLMQVEDLVEISEGKGDYELIAPTVRMDCLQKLLELISQRNNKVSLVVASGSEPELQDAIRYFRNYDNVVTIDEDAR
jgi:hypothetical protein